jgi:membrane protein
LGAPFWEYRLGSIGLIFAAVLMMLLSFSATILLSSVTQFIERVVPQAEELAGMLALSRVIPGLVLFGSIYLIFVSLTPRRYRARGFRKWPGALLVTVWWIATTALLPVVLTNLGGYDLTYGSLAGVIIALLFFFVIGLGVVIGAQLNAALAEPPEPTVEDIKVAEAEAVVEQAAIAEREAELDEVKGDGEGETKE